MIRRLVRDRSGFTIIELLVSMIAFVAVFSAIMMMVTVATRDQERIAQRVSADGRARPALTLVMDELRSACIAPRLAPVLAGSNATSITFYSRSGSDVTPLARRVTYAVTPTNTLTKTVYTATGGAAPTWTFSGTPDAVPGVPSGVRTMLNNVTAPGGVAFRYYDYVNGALSTTPLSVTPSGLSSTNAARAAHITVSLNVGAQTTSRLDTKSPITLTDSADLLLESASPVASQDNLPCT